MARHQWAWLFWGILITLVSLTIIQFSTSLNPAGFVFNNVQNVFGLSVNYNIPTILTPFYYAPTNSLTPVLQTCTFSTAFLGITDTGNIIPLSVSTLDALPTPNSLTSTQTGTTFQSFQVRDMLYCPTTIGTNFAPNLASGSASVVWTASKKDGTIVTILSDRENIQPTINGQALTLPSGTTPLNHVILYTWTVTKQQVESMLGINPLGDDFSSVQLISIKNTDTLYQGSQTNTPWSFTDLGPNVLSFTLHEITANPVGVNLLKMVLNVINPSSQQMNIQNNQVVTLQGVITNPTNVVISKPEVKLYFTDPTSTTLNTPIADFFLTADPTTSASTTGTYTYTFQYPFAQNTAVGQYTFAMSLAGNPNVAKANVYITSVAPPVCQTGYYVDFATFKCKISTTTTCPNGNVISSNQQCTTTPTNVPPIQPQQQFSNPPAISCLSNISTCFSSINLNSLGAQGTQDAFALAIIFLVFLILFAVGSTLLHMHKKQQGDEGIALDIRPEGD